MRVTGLQLRHIGSSPHWRLQGKLMNNALSKIIIASILLKSVMTELKMLLQENSLIEDSICDNYYSVHML